MSKIISMPRALAAALAAISVLASVAWAQQAPPMRIRGTIEAGAVGFTICGHDHWHEPLASYAHGQILNVDARVVVLVAPPK